MSSDSLAFGNIKLSFFSSSWTMALHAKGLSKVNGDLPLFAVRMQSESVRATNLHRLPNRKLSYGIPMEKRFLD